MALEFSNITGVEIKAPVPPDVIPQERITGDVLRGYGPRRGNLERLLRYWRPIMRREGGFRRCRVILADHPELYPLNNICAWLHHETTGLWPNEGCHHPGMKNCRRKIRGVVSGSLWNDNEFGARMARLRKLQQGKKELSFAPLVVTNSDFEHATGVLRDFMVMEPNFVDYLNNDENWEHEGEDDDGLWVPHRRMKPDNDCGCGCG